MSKINIRKRGNFYEYRIEIAKVDNKRQWLSKSGFRTKAEALEWVLHPVIDTAYFTKDFVKIPVNAARNLYNTAADKINQKASEHNAKAYEKRKANTRKWISKKKAEPAQYISL